MPFKMLTGTVQFADDVDTELLAEHLAHCLREVRAAHVRVNGRSVTFTGGIFRMVMNWNVLVPFTFGRLEIDPVERRIRYRLTITQLLVGATLCIVGMGLFILSIPMSDAGWLPWVGLPFMWLWVVGGNLLFGLPQFDGFLRRSVATAVRCSTLNRRTSDSVVNNGGFNG